MPNSVSNAVNKYADEARAAAQAVYEDWKAVAGKPYTTPIPEDRLKKLRTSNSGKMLEIIARHMLLARAKQAEADGMALVAFELRKAAADMEEEE